MNKNAPAHQCPEVFRKLVLTAAVTIGLSMSAGSALGAGDHACDYLNKDEVAAVLAAEMGEVQVQPANPMGQSICFFDIPADMAVRFAQLQMVRTAWAERGGKAWNAPSLFENNMSYLDNLQEIAGIGEKAYWGGSGMKLGAGLHVLYKDAYFTIQTATGDEQNNLQKAKELAAVILKKIN
jgi:hypothetical protein